MKKRLNLYKFEIKYVIINIDDGGDKMILGIMETLQEFADKLREWTIANTNNPLFWLGAFALGLVIFKVTYDALNKN